MGTVHPHKCHVATAELAIFISQLPKCLFFETGGQSDFVLLELAMCGLQSVNQHHIYLSCHSRHDCQAIWSADFCLTRVLVQPSCQQTWNEKSSGAGGSRMSGLQWSAWSNRKKPGRKRCRWGVYARQEQARRSMSLCTVKSQTARVQSVNGANLWNHRGIISCTTVEKSNMCIN